MKHFLGTFAAPALHHPSLQPERLAAFFPGATLEHRWAPHGYTLMKLEADRRLILHTWPELGLVTLDLYGDHDLEAQAEALGQALCWRRLAAEAVLRLLPDLQSL